MKNDSQKPKKEPNDPLIGDPRMKGRRWMIDPYWDDGKTFKKTTSVAELKHLAEDAGKTKKEIKKIKAPKEEIRFEADGVILNA